MAGWIGMETVTWGAPPHRAQAIRRPDGRWVLRLPEDSGTWSTLVAAMPESIEPALFCAEEGRAGDLLAGLGFTVGRTDQLWEVPVTSRKTPIRSADHDLVPVTACDAAAVTRLDNAIRAQIPGTAGWLGTVEDLRASLDDDDFDPGLYLVAVHRGTGSYDGLVRVWNSRPHPRLGCVGVRPEWRRTRLGPALLSAVSATLARRGVSRVVTETDVTNLDSHALAARNGAVPRGRIVEWRLQRRPTALGDREGAVPAERTRDVGTITRSRAPDLASRRATGAPRAGTPAARRCRSVAAARWRRR